MEGLLWGMCAGGIAGFTRQLVMDWSSERRKARVCAAKMRDCPHLRALDTTEEHLLGLFELAAAHGPDLATEHALLDRAARRIEAVAESYVHAMREERVDMCEATLARTAGITALNEIGEAIRSMIPKVKDVGRLTQARKHIENNVQQLLKCLQTLALAKKSGFSAAPLQVPAKMVSHGRKPQQASGNLRPRKRKRPRPAPPPPQAPIRRRRRSARERGCERGGEAAAGSRGLEAGLQQSGHLV